MAVFGRRGFLNLAQATAKLISGGRIDYRLDRALDDAARDIELALIAFAPRKTGNLARGIRAFRAGKVVNITITARSRGSGFDYVAVTRFGHRVAYIYPHGDRAAATVLATGRKRATGHTSALRFVGNNGSVFYRRRVKGYRPKYDWVDRASPSIKRAGDETMRKLGRNIQVGGI